MLSVKRETVNTNFEVIGLMRLEIKPESSAPEAGAFTTQLSELFKNYFLEIERSLNSLVTGLSSRNIGRSLFHKINFNLI